MAEEILRRLTDWMKWQRMRLRYNWQVKEKKNLIQILF